MSTLHATFPSLSSFLHAFFLLPFLGGPIATTAFVLGPPIWYLGIRDASPDRNTAPNINTDV